jgi:hypothetical protein
MKIDMARRGAKRRKQCASKNVTLIYQIKLLTMENFSVPGENT